MADASGAQAGGRHASRMLSVEVLRIAAIAGIAVFHTFQSWFEQYAAGAFEPAAFGAVAPQPAFMAAMGLISLLGSYGNHVFYMISGYFLVPGAAHASGERPYWGPQARRTAARAAMLLASVAFYAVVMLAVDALVVDMRRVAPGKAGWLVSGLQFVWVYLVLVALAPVIGWVWRRLPHRVAATAAVLACVYAVNAYIAFVSPGEAARGLLEWRKLMSAVTYLATFVAGAALRDVACGLRARAGGGRASRVPAAALALACALACAAEVGAAATGNAATLVALSYKSTSALSFSLAAASLLFAVTRDPAWGGRSRARRAVLAATGSTLGFYIAQSITGELWHPAVDALLAGALAAPGGAAPAAFLATGAAASAAVVAALLAIDALTRAPLLKRIGLS